jgi:4-alpha-glucanotransferase
MSALRELAERMGVVSEYLDQSGTERRATTDATRVALLSAMGVAGIESGDEAACRAALATLEAEEASRPLPPVDVVREEDASHLTLSVEADMSWELALKLESGESRTFSGSGPGRVVLGDLPLGYHDVRVTLADGAIARQRRIVVPERCPSVRERTGQDKAYGLSAQLYAVRSERNWGIGDLTDVETLSDRAGSWGAVFVGLNPLHALENMGQGISPYSPLSRLFRNWIYLDVEAIPDFAGAHPANLAELRATADVDYDRVATNKLAALERAFVHFGERPATDARVVAFEAYVTDEGDELRDFATFCALTREERATYPGPSAPGLAELREARRERIRFHQWLQFEIDQQLAHAQKRGQAAGLRLGLYQDLAIGCAPDGADVWAHPHLFVGGASIGAPPDGYSAEGQNWGLPPLHPRALARDGYRYWTRLLRHALAHSGALRMDHVIGLFQQFWIPAGKSGKEGAFVTFPSRDLLGILALEAVRAHAVIVGEDLGTVPPEVPEVLARYGVLSSRVLYFEVDGGEFKPASSYAVNALTTANTHDMAPLAGWWTAREADLKLAAGIVDQEGATRARAERTKERAALARRIGVPASTAAADALTVARVHGFLARTPSTLVGVSLDDVMGESDPVNVPGTSSAQHPSWRRKYRTTLEALPPLPATLPVELRARGRSRAQAPTTMLAAPPAPRRAHAALPQLVVWSVGAWVLGSLVLVVLAGSVHGTRRFTT